MIMKETFGQRLSRYRKAKGLTQEDVAKQITISPQAVSKWENDISSPDISELSTLADILGVSVNDLLGREEAKKEEASEVASAPINEEYKKEDEDEDDRKIKEGIEAFKRKHKQEHKKIDTISIIVTSVLFTLAIIGYILLGVFWTDKGMGWKSGWVIILFPIIVGSILNCVKEKKMTNFAYPVLIVMIYMTLGFFGDYYGFSGWHPYWFLFITVPVYYVIATAVDKVIHKDDPKDPDDDDDDDND